MKSKITLEKFYFEFVHSVKENLRWQKRTDKKLNKLDRKIEFAFETAVFQ